MREYLKLMRVHHYIKNLLIFAPVLFGGYLNDWGYVRNAVLGFLDFCLLTSVIYIINDLNDVEGDKKHSIKCRRPIASGAVSVGNAKLLAGTLLAASTAIHFITNGRNMGSWLCLGLYFLLNIGYSVGLKNVMLLDVVILVSGFLLRLVYGSVITGVALSNWLCLTVISLSFYLSLGKRRNELRNQSGSSRKVLSAYNECFLDKNMYMCMALAIVFYALWTVDPITVQRLSGDYLVWTVPVMIIICMKYSLNIENISQGDPVDVVLSDKILLAMLLVFAAMTMGIIYL